MNVVQLNTYTSKQCKQTVEEKTAKQIAKDLAKGYMKMLSNFK